MPEPELTAEAKEAIRSYVVKLLVLPATASAVLAFFLGYFIKDVATQTAYTDAYKQASLQILSLSGDAQAAKHNALEATRAAQEGKDEVIKANTAAQAASLEAQTIRNSLRTLQSLQQSENMVAGVAQDLLARADFKKSLIDSVVTDLKTIDEKISQVGRTLATNYVRLDQFYYVTSIVSGLNLDVLYGKKDIGAPVGQAAPNPGQAWKITNIPK